MRFGAKVRTGRLQHELRCPELYGVCKDCIGWPHVLKLIDYLSQRWSYQQTLPYLSSSPQTSDIVITRASYCKTY